MVTVAIHPDDYTAAGRPAHSDAAAPRWAAALRERGHEVREVDLGAADVLEQLAGCDALMWRWAHFDGMAAVAKRVLPAVERDLGLAVYPNQATCWHYDDKLAQALLFGIHGIPSPASWTWHDASSALAFVDRATYPLVLKLSGGAGSSNVALVQDRQAARHWVELAFKTGFRKLPKGTPGRPRWWLSRAMTWFDHALHAGNARRCPTHLGYIYFQQFAPGNEFDTRVTVIGKHVWAFRRFNRPNDFRASGSGLIDYDPDSIDPEFLEIAQRTAEKLGMQCCAIDGVYLNGRPVVLEVSYTFISELLHDCPGHWVQEADSLTWVPGHAWPEDAQIEGLLASIGRTS